MASVSSTGSVSANNNYAGSYNADWGTGGNLNELELVVFKRNESQIATGRKALYTGLGRLELYLEVITLKIYGAKTGKVVAEKKFTAKRDFPIIVHYLSNNRPSKATSYVGQSTLTSWVKRYVDP